MSEERTELEKTVDQEIIAKGPEVIKDFNESEAIVIPAKKNKGGRPKKVVVTPAEIIEVPVRQFRCSTCQESFDVDTIMRLGAGDNRYAAFCPNCQKSLGFIDEAFQQKVKDLIDNNPTGK